MPLETRPWSIMNSYKNDEEMAFFLNFLIEDGDIETFCDAVGDIMRARGVSEIAQKTDLTRAGLYKAFSRTGHPKLETVAKVMAAIGFRLKVEALPVSA